MIGILKDAYFPGDSLKNIDLNTRMIDLHLQVLQQHFDVFRWSVIAAAVLVSMALIVIAWQGYKLEKRIKALEADLTGDEAVLDVAQDDHTVMRLTLAQLRDLARSTGRPVPANFIMSLKPTS